MHEHDNHSAASVPQTVRDPVCGMDVGADTPHRHMHEGEEVLFCSAHCKTKFVAAPEKYLMPAASGSCCSAHKHEGHDGHHHNTAPHTDAPKGAKWTCPMHPEIVRDGPGSCPICGLSLIHI